MSFLQGRTGGIELWVYAREATTKPRYSSASRELSTSRRSLIGVITRRGVSLHLFLMRSVVILDVVAYLIGAYDH